MARKIFTIRIKRSPILMMLLLLMILGTACSGQIGAVGPSGSQGAAGPAGEQGLQGPPGPAGSAGPAGAAGPQGDRGSAGAQGAQGSAGTPGESASSDAGTAPVDLVAGGAAMDARAHPLSAAARERLTGAALPASGADELIALLDEANVEKAMMASFGFHARGAPDDAASSAENDFTAEEVAKSPDRLIGFCGINPLYSGALEEIDRCLGLDGMVGIKLQIPVSGVDLTNADHVTALSAVFAKAEERDAPVQLHTQPPPMDPSATANLAEIITAHPDVRVLHSHCGGFIDEHLRQVWLTGMRPNADTSFLDLSGCLLEFEDAPLSKRELIVWMLRKWGIERLLWSSDHLVLRGPTHPLSPLGALDTLTKYPFTQEELDLILNNDASAWLEGQ